MRGVQTLTLRPQGQASDIVIHAQEIEKLRSRLNQLYLSHCAQPLDVIGTGRVGQSMSPSVCTLLLVAVYKATHACLQREQWTGTRSCQPKKH